jgi:hypothetical protein
LKLKGKWKGEEDTKSMKYETAWDNRLQRHVTPEQVSNIEAHDKIRFFSEKFDENENKGFALTLHKQSKPYDSKYGKQIVRRAHFSAIAENTVEYRKKTTELSIRQESIVHKLCKEVIKDIEFIKVPEVKATIVDSECIVVPEQFVKIEFKCVEKKDDDTGRIPDAIVIADLLGVKQEVFIEFLYKHEVDENKRKMYNAFKKNCLEVDLSYLRDNLEESEKSLRTKIKSTIENECYWVSNSIKQYAENEAQSKYVIEFNKNTILNDSKFYTRDQFEDRHEWLEKRLYVFKDDIPKISNIDNNHPCYFVAEDGVEYSQSERCTDIGNCLHCNNCVWISNYSTENTSNTKVFCKRNGDKKRVNPVELTNNIIKEAIKLSEIER